MKDRSIIGIAGKARSGKDTLADYFIDNLGCRRFAFADPMKEHLKMIFGWSNEHLYGALKDVVDKQWGFSPRRAMQLFGTEFGRALDPNLWIKIADKKFLGPGQWIITDVRFDNEADFVRRNGRLIHIKRPACEVVLEHISEVGVTQRFGDLCILNDGSIFDLFKKAKKYVDIFENCL